MGKTPRVVEGQPAVDIDLDEFRRRIRQRFYDPAFDELGDEVEAIIRVAYDALRDNRKAPRTRKAGSGYADPDYDLSLDWIAAKDDIERASSRQRDPSSKSRILLVCGSPRNDHTCPGEMSKTYRLVEHARETLDASGDYELDVLDLGRLTSEYGRVIYPCKGCVSTAMPLCHWPCSCYPNHALGQTQDWMNEIFARWTAAHGVMLVLPVHWFQATSVVKLMMDRMVCADGGNPDPTRTNGKDPRKAKAIELEGWDYPKHLAGRAFSIVVHGDAEGVDDVKEAMRHWLSTLGLIEAGSQGVLGRYIGYYRPYATSHDDLDRDEALWQEVRNAALALGDAVRSLRSGEAPAHGSARPEPRPK